MQKHFQLKTSLYSTKKERKNKMPWSLLTHGIGKMAENLIEIRWLRESVFDDQTFEANAKRKNAPTQNGKCICSVASS